MRREGREGGRTGWRGWRGSGIDHALLFVLFDEFISMAAAVVAGAMGGGGRLRLRLLLLLQHLSQIEWN